MRRRQFAFWFGFGLFSLGEKLHLGGLDRLAAATMRLTKSDSSGQYLTTEEQGDDALHWTAAENRSWQWFERQTLIGGRWKTTGITTPIHKQTGERYTGKTGYLDDHLAPKDLRHRNYARAADEHEPIEPPPHTADASRRARHGRPPSRWLRSLHAEEIRTWLKTIDIPEAGVSGMTYWTHLTRDHSFDPIKIEGLNEPEQAKLHAAAHYGY
jgi:hypothetical protein